MFFLSLEGEWVFHLAQLFFETTVIQNFVIQEHGTITKVFKRYFVPAFAAKIKFVWLRIWTTVSFATPANHCSAAEVFLQETRFSFVAFLMFSALKTRKKLVVGLAKKTVGTVSTSQRVPHLIHCWSDTFIHVVLG